MHRRSFLKSLFAVPALVRGFAEPAWQRALRHPMTGLFNPRTDIAAQYANTSLREGASFEYLNLTYVVPAARCLADRLDGAAHAAMTGNWCATFDVEDRRQA